HPHQRDISLAAGHPTRTRPLSFPTRRSSDLDASSLTANITGTSGGNFEHLVVGTASATAQVNDTITDATVDLSASTVFEGAVAKNGRTHVLSHVTVRVPMPHTDQDDITIADG